MKTLKVSKSTIFKLAHRKAKEINKKGDCYAVTFGACLKAAYANSSITISDFKYPEFALTEKGGNKWEKGNHRRVYFSQSFGQKGLYVDLDTNEITIETENTLYVDFIAIKLIQFLNFKNGIKNRVVCTSATKLNRFIDELEGNDDE